MTPDIDDIPGRSGTDATILTESGRCVASAIRRPAARQRVRALVSEGAHNTMRRPAAFCQKRASPFSESAAMSRDARSTWAALPGCKAFTTPSTSDHWV
eukprot:5522072-Pyramimonas_sp.AAC.1